MTKSESLDRSEKLDKGWSFARGTALVLEPIPSRIESAIVTLRRNHFDNLAGGLDLITEESYRSISQVDKNASLRTPLYFAASTLFPEKFAMAEDDTTKAILSVLKPDLFAAFLSILYFYRRILRLGGSEVGVSLLNAYLANVEIGFIVGKALRTLGPADGVLIGGIRYAALGAMLLSDAKAYEKFKKGRHKFDIDSELSGWGCTHAQIAAYLVFRLGYGYSLVEANSAIDPSSKGAMNPTLEQWRLGLRLIDALKEKTPVLKHDLLRNSLGSEILSSVSLLQEQVHSIVKNGSSFSWFNRGSLLDEKSASQPSGSH